MPAMTKLRVPAHRTIAVLAALTSVVACKRGQQSAIAPASQLDLRPVAAARADLVTEIVLPNLDRTLASVGAMAKRLSLPFGDAELRQMLVAKSQLPPGVVDRTDLTKPIAVVLLVGPKAAAAEGTTS